MTHLAVIFASVGPYHAARLRAASKACAEKGWRLTAVQITNAQGEHPWGTLSGDLPFPIETILSCERSSGSLNRTEWEKSARRLGRLLDRLKPDAVAIPGWGFSYSRAALSWCNRHDVRAIVMSESKRDDEPRTWWKEWLKARLYVGNFDGALVGGAQHREYLVELGLSTERIFTGYDVVDNNYFASAAARARQDPTAARERAPAIPARPYFFAATRFIPRKNLPGLIQSYAAYRKMCSNAQPWDLVISGSGEQLSAIRQLLREADLESSVHLPGFLTYEDIGDWYGLASAFVHPALQEQWGLVVNEAMAAGLPALVSNRCGCYRELVQESITGFGFDPENSSQLTSLLVQISDGSSDTLSMGRSAASHIENFTPAHFASGLMRAVEAAA